MKSVVLLSAGLDSTVNLAKAVAETEVLAAITYFYGQKAAVREMDRAGSIAEHYGIPHAIIDLGCLPPSESSLTGPGAIPELKISELDDAALTAASAAAVWVPNRNGVFINVGAAIAEANLAELLVVGFNAEEAATFPDNSSEFVAATNLALSFSTRARVTLTSYTQDLLKADIIKLGLDLKAPLELVWSCYTAGDIMCGVCESCARFKRAARQAGAAFLIEGRFSVDN
jgi:7-cyano-7-deazaguanine synthase